MPLNNFGFCEEINSNNGTVIVLKYNGGNIHRKIMRSFESCITLIFMRKKRIMATLYWEMGKYNQASRSC